MHEKTDEDVIFGMKEAAYDFAVILYKQFTIFRQDGRNNQDKNYEDNLINQ